MPFLHFYSPDDPSKNTYFTFDFGSSEQFKDVVLLQQTTFADTYFSANEVSYDKSVMRKIAVLGTKRLLFIKSTKDSNTGKYSIIIEDIREMFQTEPYVDLERPNKLLYFVGDGFLDTFVVRP